MFLYSYESRDQKKLGKKRAKQFFQKHTNCAMKKMLGKNRRKTCQKTFFIFTRISCQKMGGKNARNNFYRRTRIVRVKNVGIKIVGKSAKKLFLYSHEYHQQKMGEKMRETIFTEAHE